MEKTTVNQVRQVLMNELGLDRTYIRSVVEEVVKETVVKHMNTLDERGILRGMVRDEFTKLCAKGRYEHEPIRALVLDQAKKQIEEFVRNNLKITNDDQGGAA